MSVVLVHWNAPVWFGPSEKESNILNPGRSIRETTSVSCTAVINYHKSGGLRACPVAQLVKNLPAVQETWVRSLGWEDPLEKGKATHSNILAWRIPWTVYSMGLQTQAWLSGFHFHFWWLKTAQIHHHPALEVISLKWVSSITVLLGRIHFLPFPTLKGCLYFWLVALQQRYQSNLFFCHHRSFSDS